MIGLCKLQVDKVGIKTDSKSPMETLSDECSKLSIWDARLSFQNWGMTGDMILESPGGKPAIELSQACRFISWGIFQKIVYAVCEEKMGGLSVFITKVYTRNLHVNYNALSSRW